MTTIIMPYLIVDGADAAIKLYQKLFDAEVLGVIKPNGERIMNAMLTIDGQRLMVMDPYPEHNPYFDAPTKLKGVSNTTHIQVDTQHRVDEIYARIDDQFAHLLPPAMQFWGDYYCQFTDPFGQSWSVGYSPNGQL